MFRIIAYCLVLTYLASCSVHCAVLKNLPLKVSEDAAVVARKLVHQSNWASVGTISTNSKIRGFPIVNVISIDDGTKIGQSNGKIHFMLTDLDFTGMDWRASNKVTFLLTDEQNKNCEKRSDDPMSPTCARAYISGTVVELDKTASNYQDALDEFINRHPAARVWINVPGHAFYLCELKIENIFVMSGFGGPKSVTPKQYYDVKLGN